MARARRVARLALLALVLPLLLAGPAGAERLEELEANGRWHAFDIDAPGRSVDFLFEVLAGCRYRLVAEGRTLARVRLEVGPGVAVRWRADSADAAASPEPGAGPENGGAPGGDGAPPGAGEAEAAGGPSADDRPTARLVFDAEVDGVYTVRLKGFSVLTGKGRVKVETLDHEGRPTQAHRRFLVPDETLARVGSLWVDGKNVWRLALPPGAYAIHSRPGTSGPIALRLLEPDGDLLAEALPDGLRPWPTLRFEVPEGPGSDADDLRLEVRAVDGAGGTYGVRLETLRGRRAAAPEDEPGAVSGEPSAEGAIPAAEGAGPQALASPPLAFRAGPGDLAVLYLPRSPAFNPHALGVREGERWSPLPGDPLTPQGRRASMRTPEEAALVWFRPHAEGTFRFFERRPADAVLRLYAAEEVRGAPLLLGTGLDPSVMADGTSAWKTIGLGVCMPGWPYLFVAVGQRRAAVSMRVETVDGSRLAHRPARGMALSHVAGLGPSLRFRVREPTVVRLQVKGRGWEGYALLRRASN